jgi:hypothetical protein
VINKISLSWIYPLRRKVLHKYWILHLEFVSHQYLYNESGQLVEPWSLRKLFAFAMSAQSNGKLSAEKQKQILQDIEEERGQHVVHFKTLCDKIISFYNKIASEKRQKIFGNLKLLHISRYIDTLKQFGIALSPNMTAEHLAPKAAIDQAKAGQTIENPLAAVSSKEESELSNKESAPAVAFPSPEVENQMSTVKLSQGTPLQGSHTSSVMPN